jgi:hypothetical protein
MSPAQNTFGVQPLQNFLSHCSKAGSSINQASSKATMDKAEDIRHTLVAGLCRIVLVKILGQVR